jgi:hypothetical protein
VGVRLAYPELAKVLSAGGVRCVSGEVRGSFSRGADMVEAFRYPVSGDIDAGKVFTWSFLRAVPPGPYKVKLVFALPGGKKLEKRTINKNNKKVDITIRT